MIELRRPAQYSLGDGLIYEEASDLWEPWMRHVDQALEDEELLRLIQQELMKTLEEEQNPRTQGHPGRSHSAHVIAQTRPRLELRSTVARGARQLGLSRLHARRRQQSP